MSPISLSATSTRLTALSALLMSVLGSAQLLYADPLPPQASHSSQEIAVSGSSATQLEEARAEVIKQVNEALNTLKASSPELKLTQRASSLSPNLLLKLNEPLAGVGGQEQAQDFITRFAKLWAGLEVSVHDVKTRRFRSIAHLKASVGGLPVFNQDARLLINPEGRAERLSSALSAVFEVRAAKLKEVEAARLALTHLSLPLDAPYLAKLGYVVHAGVATATFEIEAGATTAQQHPVVLIDAVEGVVLSVQDRVRR